MTLAVGTERRFFYTENDYDVMADDPTIPIGDVRQENPGSDRQGAFKRGWTAAVKDLKDNGESSKYSEGPPPDELTWDNLGYRLGSLFGDTDEDLRQDLFEWCKEKQKRENEP